MAMNRTKIEWVRNPDGSQGFTWNPLTGCLNGCEYCYARKLANGRLKQRYLANTHIAPTSLPYNIQTTLALRNPFYPRFWPSRLRELGDAWDRRTWHKTIKGIFVCDMSDLFGIGIPEEWTRQVLSELSDTPHRFYLLTKQPQNLIKFSPFPDNCWVGVTATSFKMFVDALAYQLCIKAKVKYISFEPLLSWDKVITNSFAYSRELGHSFGIDQLLREASIHWVIIGAQTKPYKPPKLAWVEEIIFACVKANIPYFLKDNLGDIIPGHQRGEKLRQEFPK